MTPAVPSYAAPVSPLPSRAPWWNYVVLALLPALLSVLNRDWAFQDLGSVDAWYYFGNFIHFPRSLLVYPNYPSERVLWILPGYAPVHLFGAAPGVFLLHCLVVWACLFLLHYILLQVADHRTALIGALMLGCHPFFVGPNGAAGEIGGLFHAPTFNLRKLGQNEFQIRSIDQHKTT